MARLIDEIRLVWRALQGSVDSSGHRILPVGSLGPCRLYAGLTQPDATELIRIDFAGAPLPTPRDLPKGQGFAVERVRDGKAGDSGLVFFRNGQGSTEIFEMIVCDLLETMLRHQSASERQILNTFLNRIRMWQAFMKRGGNTLDPAAEIGLVGELVVLLGLVESGVAISRAVESWVGPLDAIQDFELGSGAIEVKTTVSTTGFPVRIGTLEQLDDNLRQPLLLAGVRLVQNESGTSLPEFVDRVRSDVEREAAPVLPDLDRRLALGGYDAVQAPRYGRRFRPVEIRILRISTEFPRLTPGTVPAGVTAATYEIDLDRIVASPVTMKQALESLGSP